MKDRIPAEGKAGRVLITPENGSAPFYATVTMADEPLDEGTPLNKANLLTDETAGFYGKDENATVNNVLAELGVYMQYWWKARSVEGHYAAVFGATETVNLTVGPGANSYTLSYSSSYEINQTTGEVALVNPAVIEKTYNEDVSATLRGKYFSTTRQPGKIFSAGSNAVFDSSYTREDGVSFYSATLTNCSQITSKYVESIGDYYYLRSNDRNACPDSGIVGGIEYHFLGKPFDNAIGAPRVAIGTYRGTGTTGSSNKNILTFDFVPKIVFIVAKTTSMFHGYDSRLQEWIMLVNGMTQTFTKKTETNSGTGTMTISWSNKTVSWYASWAGGQLNTSGVDYLYVAFG